jgi:hypothetical protein
VLSHNELEAHRVFEKSVTHCFFPFFLIRRKIQMPLLLCFRIIHQRANFTTIFLVTAQSAVTAVANVQPEIVYSYRSHSDFVAPGALQRFPPFSLVSIILQIVASHGTAIPVPLGILPPHLLRPITSAAVDPDKPPVVDNALTLMPAFCTVRWMFHADAAPFVRRVT